MERREFMRYTAAAVGAGVAGAGARAQESAGPLKKALQLGMLSKELSDAEKFALAKRCGFEGIEAYPMQDLEAAKRLGEAARAAGVPVHSITYGGWKSPLSHPEPRVVERGLGEIENAMRTAKAMGADVVLLVPAVVNAEVRYVEAYERTREHIPKLFPLAEELGVIVAVENVWNNFLLSPIEFAQYVDDFDSPWLRGYFDIGNVVAFGWSEDWIRTLGKRIVRCHLKDFKRKEREWTNLRDGDVNWPEVRKALGEVGYEGFLTTELRGGDEDYLQDLGKRVDLIFAGE
jgi:L-ribulose-5-phosphate 3-epimerase